VRDITDYKTIATIEDIQASLRDAIFRATLRPWVKTG
jgi:hypothetical protein